MPSCRSKAAAGAGFAIRESIPHA